VAGERGIEAFTAMQEIKHVNRRSIHLVSQCRGSAERKAAVVHHPAGQDASAISTTSPRSWQVESRYELTSEKRKRHRNVYSVPPPLSDKAIKNLRRWYAADIQFYELARAWAEQHQDQGQEKSSA